MKTANVLAEGREPALAQPPQQEAIAEPSTATEVATRGLVELYVALKSKPMAILCGPAGAGKLAAARTLAARLAGLGEACLQEMVGHAWWAGRSGDGALFAEAQQRFNRDKFLAMVEAAVARPSIVHIALLSRVSPAEWIYLAGLAAEFRRGSACDLASQQRRLRPIVPRNVLLIATADRPAPSPWDSGLLRSSSILPWPSPAVSRTLSQTVVHPPSDEGTPFLHAMRRSPRAALRRLRRLPGWEDERLKPLMALIRAMQIDGVSSANCVANEAIIYLANAWTWGGSGLFARSFDENFREAMRLAVILSARPRLEDRIVSSPEISQALGAVLSGPAGQSLEPIRARLAVPETELGAWSGAGGPGSSQRTDPVCGMEIDPKSAAAKLAFEGRTYVFCSISCKQAFEEDPKKYAGSDQGPAHHHPTV